MLPAPKKPFSSLATLLAVTLVGALAGPLAGCAAQPPARHVRAADLGTIGPLDLEQPLVVEFEAGDVIPLQFTLDGPFVKSPDGAPPIPLKVVRHFFLRIDKNGLRASADGQSFDAKSVKPGQFQAGIGITKEGATATIKIRTPTPPGLEK